MTPARVADMLRLVDEAARRFKRRFPDAPPEAYVACHYYVEGYGDGYAAGVAAERERARALNGDDS